MDYAQVRRDRTGSGELLPNDVSFVPRYDPSPLCLKRPLKILIAVFGSFFTTLAFLLESPPYNYNELVIGVFGLVGIVGVVAAPFVGRTLDKLVLWVGVMIGLSILLLGQVVQTIGGGLNAAAIVICIICGSSASISHTY